MTVGLCHALGSRLRCRSVIGSVDALAGMGKQSSHDLPACALANLDAMPRVTVVDVGDGACTVLRCCCLGRPCGCELAVVDCGVYKGKAQGAKDKLTAVLGAEGLLRLGTVIVTHFDQDHWNGLDKLARQVRKGDIPDAVRMVYPRMPDRSLDVAALQLALDATIAGTGVRSLDLMTTWGRVTKVIPIPVFQGCNFEAVGRAWNVLWPPQRLTSQLRRLLQKAVDETEQLAEELAEHDHPALRENLRIAREVGFSVQVSEPDAGVDYAEPPVEINEAPESHDVEPSNGYVNVHGDVSDVGAIPVEYREQLRKAKRSLAAANNELSLVLHDEDGHLTVFGDIQGPSLECVLQQSGCHSLVVLAPHHGTVCVPPSFPEAEACVAQAGKHHYPHWNRHVETHDQQRSCMTTARTGTVSFW